MKGIRVGDDGICCSGFGSLLEVALDFEPRCARVLPKRFRNTLFVDFCFDTYFFHGFCRFDRKKVRKIIAKK